MICYLDSSAALRIIFNAKNAYRGFTLFEKVGSSELLLIECARVIDRYRLESVITDEQTAKAREGLSAMIDGMHIIEINDIVKRHARGSFPTIIGTLDAIHLSTAMLWKELEPGVDFQIATHDRQMITCARALGLSIMQ